MPANGRWDLIRRLKVKPLLNFALHIFRAYWLAIFYYGDPFFLREYLIKIILFYILSQLLSSKR